MRKRRPGTRLAIGLPEHGPRWVDFVLYFGFGSAFVAPTIWFLLDPTYKTFGLFEVVFGLIGVILLVIFLRRSVLALLVGETTVEISQEPAIIGRPMEYFILQGRAAAGLKSVEARFMLRRSYGRRHTVAENAIVIPLAAATVEPGGRRKIQGSLVVPDVPSERRYDTQGTEWFIEVRIRFKGGFEHEEEHPFAVEARFGEAE